MERPRPAWPPAPSSRPRNCSSGGAARDAALNLLAWFVHGSLALVGIFSSDYQRVDLTLRGSTFVFLQTTTPGRRLSRIIRLCFVPLCVATLWANSVQKDGHAVALRIATAALFALLALMGPLAFSALSYRRWLLSLIIMAGLLELAQLSPNVPGDANVLDFLATVIGVLGMTALGLWLRWLGRQDLEDRPLWAQPWRLSAHAVED